MTHGSLFSGIGGFDLAAQWMGWDNVFQVEIDKFCTRVLEKNFPNVKRYGDIKEFDGRQYAKCIDILTGGFPCQPFSVAGKRKGTEDDRHLWPEMLRTITEVQPTWIVGENVPGLLTWERGMVFHEIKTDLEAAGFEVFPALVLPACSKNAPHKRDRLWVVAHSNGIRKRELQTTESGKETSEVGYKNSYGLKSIVSDGTTSYADLQGLQGGKVNGSTPGIRKNGNQQPAGFFFTDWKDFPTVTPLCGGNDGLPNRVDRVKSLGNSIVPQVAYEIFKAIKATA